MHIWEFQQLSGCRVVQAEVSCLPCPLVRRRFCICYVTYRQLFFFSPFCVCKMKLAPNLTCHPIPPFLFLYWSTFARPSILTLGTRMGKIDFLRVPIFLPKKARTMMYFFILLANSQPLSLITCPPAAGFGLIPGCQSIVPANCISYYYA